LAKSFALMEATKGTSTGKADIADNARTLKLHSCSMDSSDLSARSILTVPFADLVAKVR